MEWESFVAIVAIPALGFVAWLAWAAHSKADTLREKVADAEARLSAFQVEVAQKYASVAYLKDVETRLMTAMTKVETTVEKLDTKLDRLLDRGGD